MKCREDIKELWEDDLIEEVLSGRRIWIVGLSLLCGTCIYGHGFIKDADKIARRDYQHTSDNVLRAHLRTLGVQEYRFFIDHGKSLLCQNHVTDRLVVSNIDGGGVEVVRCRWNNVSCWS